MNERVQTKYMLTFSVSSGLDLGGFRDKEYGGLGDALALHPYLDLWKAGSKWVPNHPRKQ